MDKLSRSVLKIEICNSMSVVIATILPVDPITGEHVDVETLDPKFWTLYNCMFYFVSFSYFFLNLN